MLTKKLIEVALPLEKINDEAEKEKQIRHGHPSNIHQYWARRPFTTARAIIWASLVDDPSSHADLFPTEEEQNKERQRLFRILEDLVEWENSNNEAVISAAKKEILKSTSNNPPVFLDPFSGGGAIPFEAQRLGLEAHAHDLNPVAVMINKSMIEIPYTFYGMSPVNPLQRMTTNGWSGLSGLGEDIRYYGEWIEKEAFKKIGDLYPRIKCSNGTETTVISWIWARNVKCPNPVCGCKTPLARSFELSRKKGEEYYISPVFKKEKFEFDISQGKCKNVGSVDRNGAICQNCGEAIPLDYIRSEGKENRIGYTLMAIAGEAKRGRVYCPPTVEHELAADVPEPQDVPESYMPEQALGFRVQAYGMDQHKKLFTNRQLTVLTIFCELIQEAQIIAEQEAINAGLQDDHISMSDGGYGAKAYAQAIGLHLAFLVDKMAPLHSNLTLWKSGAQCPLSFFGRQAIPMAWDFAEANPFSNSSGSFKIMLDGYVKALVNSFETRPDVRGYAIQHEAQCDCGMSNIMISTDPPYYDNIDYSDLSDFFYIWMRQSMEKTYPELFGTMLVPKSEELIATPFRHNGSIEAAKQFFEDGMMKTCQQIYKAADSQIPVTIYYAYKQSDTAEIDGKQQTSSSGWETMINAIISAGFIITGTWPVRTEKVGRNRANGSNALASSIVIVCRKRESNAPQTTRRNLVNSLRRELRPALKKLQESNIAPVDLAQSAIGPGMAVFSQYSRVLEADGSPMSVRSALQLINEEIDLYFNEQVGDLDIASRFCVDLYTQKSYNDMKYGEAEILANAKGTSIPMLASRNILYAKAGIVRLIERTELPEKVDLNESNIWLLTQQLTFAMEKGGIDACAKTIFNMFGSNAERAKDLAYRLYTIAENKKWANEAYAYNALVVAWPDIQARAAAMKADEPVQMDIFSMNLFDKN